MTETREQRLTLASDLITDFNSKIANRNGLFVFGSANFMARVLTLHRKIWEEAWQKIEGDAVKWHAYSIFEHQLADSVTEIQDLVLTKQQIALTTYFSILKKHLDAHASDEVVAKGVPRAYIDDLHIFDKFFEKLPSLSDTYSQVWDTFPQEWRVTAEHLEKNVVTSRWLVAYMRWAQNQIHTNEMNWALDRATSSLFPSVDPISWATIVFYVLNPNKDAASIIGQKRNFGHIGRIYTSWYDGEDSFSKLNEESQRGENESAKFAAFLSYRYQPFFVAFHKIGEVIAVLKNAEVNQQDERAVLQKKYFVSLFEQIQDWRKKLAPEQSAQTT